MSQTELKLLKKFLRLSSQRDLYTIPQAAFRLNCSVNEFNKRFVETGAIKLVIENGKSMIPASEINYAIEKMQTIIHKSSLRAVSFKR